LIFAKSTKRKELKLSMFLVSQLIIHLLSLI